MATVEKVRIDKWLWAIRIFKSRSLATEACSSGKVKVGGKSVKPSYKISIGDTITARKGRETKIVKAVKLIEKRVGAAIAADCYEDFSPPPLPSTKKEKPVFFDFPVALREKGSGRPTKRERRSLDKFKDIKLDFYNDFTDEEQ